jgi:hypothetical protein
LKTIKGLPNDAPPELRQAIVNAAQTRRGTIVDVARVNKVTPTKTCGIQMPRLDQNDLVLTGPDAQLLTNIGRPVTRIIIYSTFHQRLRSKRSVISFIARRRKALKSTFSGEHRRTRRQRGGI